MPDNFHVPAGSFCTLVIVPVLSPDGVLVVVAVLFVVVDEDALLDVDDWFVVYAWAILTDEVRDNMHIARSDAIETTSGNL